MTEKNRNEMATEEMDTVDTVEISDDSANAEDAPEVAFNEENEIEDNSPPAVNYLDPTLFKEVRTVTREDLDSSAEQTEISEDVQNKYLGSISKISEKL